MADGVPLNLLLEPGEYRVEWQLPTQTGGTETLQGDLELVADRPPRGNAFGDVPVKWETAGAGGVASFPQIYEVSTVVGRLLNGFTVVLIGAVIEIWMSERAVIHARAALLGREPVAADTVQVVGVDVQVEGLDAITGIGPIGKVKIPLKREEGKRDLDWSWEAVGNPDSTQTWTDDDAEVELQFYSSVTAPEAFFFRVTFSPVVWIRPSRPIPFDEVFSEWVEPLRRIVSLATGRKEKITYLAVRLADDGGSRLFQVFGTALQQAPYSSRGNDVLKVERSFLLSPEDMSLLDLLRRWQQLRGEHHPLLETYGSMMFAPEQHPRSRLLLLLQALEGMHGHENAAGFAERVTKHKERRESALAEAAETVSAGVLRFLKTHLSRRPPTGLQQVLGETLTAVPVDVTEDLGRSALVTEVMVDPRKPTNSYDALRLVRNDLAHGARGYDAQAVHDVAQLLDGVVRAHMLRILDCSEDAQRRDQERRRR